MIDWCRKIVTGLRERRRIAKQIDPRTFREMAEELGELARAAGALGPQEERFQAQIRRIKGEMEELTHLAAKPEFRRLSSTRRLELRQSLMESRRQLLEAVQNAPSPTSLLQ